MKIKVISILLFLISINLVVTAQAWTQKKDFPPNGLVHAVGFSIGSKGYIGTGTDALTGSKRDFWEYNQASDTWVKKADFGGAQRSEAVGFSVGTKGYIGTGWSPDIWEWDQVTGAGVWIQKPSIPVGRAGAAAFSIGAMGYVGTGSYYKDFWEYSPAPGPLGGTWTQKADYGGTGRTGALGFSIGSKGYIVTGVFSGMAGPVFAKDLWEYNPTADTWTKKADFPGAGRDYAVGFSIGSKGFVGTGADKAGIPLEDFWEYDPANDTWVQRPNYGGGAVRGAVGFSIGNKGYIGTGSHNPGKSDPVKSFWEYDASTQTVVCNVTPYAISDPSSICSGSTVGMVASGGDTYLWNTGETTSFIQHTPTVTTTYSVIVSKGPGCSAVTSITVGVLDCSTGISEVGSASVQAVVFPNPFNESAVITLRSMEAGLYELKIFDMLGKEVKYVNFTGKQITLQRGDLSDGVYFYKVISAGSNVTGKFIISKI